MEQLKYVIFQTGTIRSRDWVVDLQRTCSSKLSLYSITSAYIPVTLTLLNLYSLQTKALTSSVRSTVQMSRIAHWSGHYSITSTLDCNRSGTDRMASSCYS